MLFFAVNSVAARLARGLYVVSGEKAFHPVQDAFTPAVIVPLGQVDHVSFLKGQVPWFTLFVAVERHHLMEKMNHNELPPEHADTRSIIYK